MRELTKMSEWNISMSAIRALAKEKVLHKIWTENEKTTIQIAEIQQNIQESQLKMADSLSEKEMQIGNHKSTIITLNQNNINQIEKEM